MYFLHPNRSYNNSEKLLVILFCLFLGFLCKDIIIFAITLIPQGNNDSLISNKLLIGLSSIISFAFPAFAIAYLFERQGNLFSYLKINRSPNLMMYLYIFIFMISAMPLLEVISTWNASYSFPPFLKGLEEVFKNIDLQSQSATEKILTGTGALVLITNLLVMSVIPAVSEELLFRGIIQKYLITVFKNPYIGILIGAFIFSAIHLQFSGLIPRFILGSVLGFMFYCSGSLWTSIAAHFLNNAIVVLVVYIYGNTAKICEIEEVQNLWWIILLLGSVVAIFAGIKLFKKNSDQ